MTRKEYITTGYFWGKDKCQYKVYVTASQRLSSAAANDLALKQYKKYCLYHPTLTETESANSFVEYQNHKINGLGL